MRKITEQAVNAFINGNDFKQGNTLVSVYSLDGKTIKVMRLHGNEIARHENGKMFISNCGWFSNTTKERLNGLPNVRIYQKRGVWYLNGEQWDGSMIEVK